MVDNGKDSLAEVPLLFNLARLLNSLGAGFAKELGKPGGKLHLAVTASDSIRCASCVFISML